MEKKLLCGYSIWAWAKGEDSMPTIFANKTMFKTKKLRVALALRLVELAMAVLAADGFKDYDLKLK